MFPGTNRIWFMSMLQTDTTKTTKPIPPSLLQEVDQTCFKKKKVSSSFSAASRLQQWDFLPLHIQLCIVCALACVTCCTFVLFPSTARLHLVKLLPQSLRFTWGPYLLVGWLMQRYARGKSDFRLIDGQV